MSNLNAGKTTLVTLSTALVLSMFMFAKTADSSFASANCNEQNSDNNPNCSSSTPTPTATPNGKKVVICHASGKDDTLKFETLELSENAVYANDQGNGGHFNEDGTPAAGHENDYFGACGAESTPTATPTPDASATPFVSPVCTGDTHLDAAGKNCVNFEFNGAPASNGSNGQVLGASTMAGTGSFEESLYQGIMTLGATLSAFGIKGLKKAKKVSKK